MLGAQVAMLDTMRLKQKPTVIFSSGNLADAHSPNKNQYLGNKSRILTIVKFLSEDLKEDFNEQY